MSPLFLLSLCRKLPVAVISTPERHLPHPLLSCFARLPRHSMCWVSTSGCALYKLSLCSGHGRGHQAGQPQTLTILTAITTQVNDGALFGRGKRGIAVHFLGSGRVIPKE